MISVLSNTDTSMTISRSMENRMVSRSPHASTASLPDMLYVSRSYYGRSTIRCTGPKSCLAMCLCSFVPLLIFTASAFLFYNVTGVLRIIVYVLFSISGVLFFLMVILCIITCKRGCEYTKNNPQGIQRHHMEISPYFTPTSQHLHSTNLMDPRRYPRGSLPPPPAYETNPPEYSTTMDLPPSYNENNFNPSERNNRVPSAPPPPYSS